jgi:protein-disulfide isomerase
VSAAITLVGYGDYACSRCNDARGVVKQLHTALGDRMRYAFRNFPVAPSNGYLHRAAEAAEASAAQNKFWEMHDLLYDHRSTLTDRHLKAYATQVGLDMARFNRDMMLQTYSVRVYEDILSAVHSGVSSVPAFFLNDSLHMGPYDFETLLSEMQELA